MDWKKIITAIAAVGILLVLGFVGLSAIGGYTPSYGDAIVVMGQELYHVNNEGGIRIYPGTVGFYDGQEYSASAVAREAGLQQRLVEFCCDASQGEGKCEGYHFTQSDAFECAPTLLTVVEYVEGEVMAYCPADKITPCVVGFKELR